MTTVTASPIVGGTFEPAGFALTIAGAASVPTPVYASNFTAGDDSWNESGTGAVMTNDTTTNPDSLHLQGPVGSTGTVIAARAVTGLTIGATYRYAARITRTAGTVKLAVRENPGPYIADGAYLNPTNPRTLMELEFTATATDHVIEIVLRAPWPTAGRADIHADTVTVDPTAAWAGLTLTRTDSNGTDVPVRNPNHLDTVGGGLTLHDYEAALVGPVTYNVTDGLGGTAQVTTSAAPSHSNRATNPVGAGVATVDPFDPVGGTLAVQASDALRLTLTNNTATDLAQRVASPAGAAADAFTIGEVPEGSPFRARVEARCSLAPIVPATPTVPQVVIGTQGALGTSNTSINITTAPIAGDKVWVYIAVGSNSSAVTAVSGLGATWARHESPWTAHAAHTSEWWVGTGANATGVITVTSSAARNGIIRAYLVRGLSSAVATLTHTTAVGTTHTGTAVSAAGGQVVLQAAAGPQSGTSYPNPSTPATGWTTQTASSSAFYGTKNTSYRIPTGAATSHNATVTASASNSLVVENLVLGSAAGPGSTPVPIVKSRLTFSDSAGTPISSHDSAGVTVGDSVYSEVDVTEDVPAGAAYVRLEVGLSGTVARSVGDWIDVRRVILGAPADWFDGDSPDSSALQETYAWAGVPDASPSLAISTAPVEDVAPALTLPTTALLETNLDPPEFAPLTMLTVYDETSESNGTVHVVIGREDRISNPGPLMARAGTVDLFCLDYDDAAAVRTLLRDARVAMLRQSTFLGFDLYFVARSVTLRPDPADTRTRRWIASVAYDEVPRP